MESVFYKLHLRLIHHLLPSSCTACIPVVPHGYSTNPFQHGLPLPPAVVRRRGVYKVPLRVTAVELLLLFLGVTGFCALTALHVKFVYKHATPFLDETHSSVQMLPALMKGQEISSTLPRSGFVNPFKSPAPNLLHILYTLPPPSSHLHPFSSSQTETAEGHCTSRPPKQTLANSNSADAFNYYAATYTYAALPSLLSVPLSSSGLPTVPSLYCYIPLTSLDPLLPSLTPYLGLDTITLNLLLPLGGRGAFVEGYLTRSLPPLRKPTPLSPYHPKKLTAYTWLTSKLSVLLATSFLFFTTTSVVSYTLRSTQRRMLTFVASVTIRTRTNLGIAGEVGRHVAASASFVPLTVGAAFFLLAALESRLAAACVLSMAWVGEVYTAVCLRSREGQIFWPKTFFLYWALFHAYYLQSPQGFTHVALGTSGVLLAHSMVFFWGRWEVRAVVEGEIWEGRKRAALGGSDAGGRRERARTEEWVDEEEDVGLDLSRPPSRQAGVFGGGESDPHPQQPPPAMTAMAACRGGPQEEVGEQPLLGSLVLHGSFLGGA